MDEIEEFLTTLAEDSQNIDNEPDDGKDDDPMCSDEYVSQVAKLIKDALDQIVSGMAGGDSRDMFIDRYHDMEVCDMLEKDIHDLANSDSELSPSDISKLMLMAGRGNSDFNLDDYENWDDGMIGKYAEHLKNYLYTYKEEATQVDPSIDPDEEHVGPMAQDIEQVAPDCVKETPEGVKTVDGNRLALVNAGVIGDLSREVIELRSRLAALEAKL